MINTLPANEKYSCVFQGNSQVLDNAIVGTELQGAFYIVHVYSEFIYESEESTGSYHDPLLIESIM